LTTSTATGAVASLVTVTGTERRARWARAGCGHRVAKRATPERSERSALVERVVGFIFFSL